MKHLPWVIWTSWVCCCYLLVYLIMCFIDWDFVSIYEIGSAGRAVFMITGVIFMGITFWLPGIICEKYVRWY